MFKSINRVVKTLIISDFFLNSALGIYTPIFALFIMENITHNLAEAAQVAGFSALFYWTVKSLLQIPFSIYLDKTDGEKDDFYFVVFGTIIASLAPLGFMFSYASWHIYAFNIIQSIGMAMLIPSWYAIFTRHIDKKREAFEWGVNSSSLSLGVGITGALGGIIAARFGFHLVFITTAVLGIISVICLIAIRKELCETKRKPFNVPIIKPF